MQTSKTAARTFAVLHISFIFLYILWILFIPFFQSYFEAKKRDWAITYIESSSFELTPRQKIDLEKVKAVSKLLHKRTFAQKCMECLHLLFLQMPLLYCIWIIVSLNSCVRILKQSQNYTQWTTCTLFLAAAITVQTLFQKMPHQTFYEGTGFENVLSALQELSKFPQANLMASHTPIQAAVFLLWHILIALYAGKQKKEEPAQKLSPIL